MSKQGSPKVDKGTLKTAKRLLGYVTSTYKVQFVVVLFCILISSIASISVSLSLRFLLDDYIIPLIGQKDPNYSELYMALTVLGTIFLCGVIATFVYSRLMVTIGQGVLKRVRDEMFAHMQKLPIRYFDQNTNGSIMSLYTNDTDTLRQMINQSIPQVLMSGLTIVVTFISMLVLSPLLTILAVLMIVLMFFVSRFITGNSGKYFIRQQMDIADTAAYHQVETDGKGQNSDHHQKKDPDFRPETVRTEKRTAVTAVPQISFYTSAQPGDSEHRAQCNPGGDSQTEDDFFSECFDEIKLQFCIPLPKPS